MLQTKPIQNFDVYHQIVRMRSAKNMSDMEAEAITRMFVENVQTYEQVVEVCSLVPIEKMKAEMSVVPGLPSTSPRRPSSRHLWSISPAGVHSGFDGRAVDGPQIIPGETHLSKCDEHLSDWLLRCQRLVCNSCKVLITSIVTRTSDRHMHENLVRSANNSISCSHPDQIPISCLEHLQIKVNQVLGSADNFTALPSSYFPPSSEVLRFCPLIPRTCMLRSTMP